MVSEVLSQTLYGCCLPAVITLLSAVSALFLKISKNTESSLGHFAGGVVLSACANELLPKVAGDDVGIGALSSGFFAGMLLMMAVRKFFPEDDDDDDDDDKKETLLEGGQKAPESKGDGALPCGTIVPMIIDFVLDGVLIGLGYAAGGGGDSSTGFIMVVSLSIEKITLGSSTTFAMKKKGVSTPKAMFVITMLAASMFLGGGIGATVVASLQGQPIFYSAIAFGVAALLWLVTEELLEEAHSIKDTPMTPVFFFCGFLIPMVLDKLG